MTLPVSRRANAVRAFVRRGGRVRAPCMASPLRTLATQLAFKVTGSPAVLFQAVRGKHQG